MLRRNVRGPGRYTFGRTLRDLRTRRRPRLSMAACASALGISTSVWNEVELGNCEPFTDAQLAKIEQTILHLNRDEAYRLNVAAITTRGYVTLPVGGLSTPHRELAFVLARQWKSLTPDQVNTIGLMLTSDGLPD